MGVDGRQGTAGGVGNTPAGGTPASGIAVPGTVASPGRYLALAALLVVVDQLTKWIAVSVLDFGQRVAVIPGFFDFTLVYNRGAAFSFLAGADGWQRWFFTVVALVASGIIVWMLHRHRGQRLFSFSLALILGGAIGNVIDRVLHGQVTDFVLLYWQGWHWPAFNVADMGITFGAVLLVIDELLRMRRGR